MSPSIPTRHTLILLMAASFIVGCTHTGAVHYANDTTVNPDADVATEELMNEEGITSLGAGPGGYR
ncbi:MAG: hypothetical protein ACOYBQ_09020 [Fluviibacter sp.]|jgi:hypothetical protein